MQDQRRTHELRQRYLTLFLDGLRTPPATSPLPWGGPTDEEREEPWIPKGQ